MARTPKKEKALTPEEKLAQALVPDVEQPYRVPDNWCWIHLLDSFYNRTDSKKKIQQKTYLEEGTLAIVDQGQEVVGGYSNDDEMRYTGTLPVIIFGDHTRCIKYVDFPFAQGADGVKVLAPKECFLPKAFYYDLHSIDIPNMGYRRHYPLFKNYSIPLPPLAEQQRIVDRIESLFAKLDEAKEKARTVVDGFEDRKAAILYKAFTGELTAAWRQKNGETLSWDKVLLGNIILDGPQNGLYKPKTVYGKGTKILRIDGFYDGYLEPWDTLKRLSLNEEEKSAYLLHINDIVVNRVNSMPFLGKSALIRALPEPCVFESNMMRIAIDQDRACPEYVIKYLNSSLGLTELRKNAKQAVNQASINQQDVKAVCIPLPSVDEQNEIVTLVDRLIRGETHAKEIAELVIDQIDTMKKSILARAFRGELGTNNPADESAVELLKRVLCDDVPAPQRAKPVTIPKGLSKSLRNDLEKKIIKLYFQRDAAILSVKEIMSVSSKTFEVLDCLRSLQNRQIIIKQEDGNYRLMG